MSEEIVACEHAARCPGCPLIDLPYRAQLDRKRTSVARAFADYPSLESIDVAETIGADSITEYRTRVKLPVATSDDRAAIGLYASATDHAVVDLPRCRVVPPTVATLLDWLRSNLPETPAGRSIDAIDVRVCVDRSHRSRLLLALIAPTTSFRDGSTLAAVRAFATRTVASVSTVAGVSLSLRAQGSRQLLGTETILLAGDDEAEDAIGDVAHLARPGAFVQAHRGQAAIAHRRIVDAIAPKRGALVLDLFGGSGAIGLALAAAGADVVVVESFAPAVDRARTATKWLPLGSGSLKAEHADVDRFLARSSTLAGPRPRAVVVNPPRRGLTRATRDAIATLRPEVVAYLSCNPSTLARDLDHLAELGFVADRAQPIDMIPLTDHVETLVVLRSATPRPRPAVDRDATTDAIVLARGEGRALSSLEGATTLATIGGRTVLRTQIAPGRLDDLSKRLAKIGHPIVGDGRHGHAATNRHFFEKHGLDRAFVHLGGGALAGDLVAVLRSLGAVDPRALVERR